MGLLFGTKAQTLANLEGQLQYASVLPQLIASTAVLQQPQSLQLLRSELEKRQWLDIDLVVRSSAQNEDSFEHSLAGHYDSVLHVRGWLAFCDAMQTVAQSYGPLASDEELLIQPQLLDVAISGVIFSRDPSTLGHYWVINYDPLSGRTDSVTSGEKAELETCYIAKSCPLSYYPEGPLGTLLLAAKELELLFNCDHLDIEFAFDKEGRCFILQVRPLVKDWSVAPAATESADALAQVAHKFGQLNRRHPFLGGERTVFGVMPDWNPAEIIGVRPRPLAMSLYKELVTDSIWAYQRDNYGYRNLRSFPLLHSFAGVPFIDVRVSFNSFVPGDLGDELTDKLVDYYISQLVKNPTQHDKVEFEIILSCYTLDLPQRLESLKAHGFDDDELMLLQQSLRGLTNRIINSENGLWLKDIEKIETLKTRQQSLFEADLPVFDKIYWIIEDCKRYGTLPFAGLARAGFIAVQMLKSMVTVGILSEQNYASFMNSLETISSALGKDQQQMEPDSFLELYGHLRPGTYDITSLRYDEAQEFYLAKSAAVGTKNLDEFHLSLKQLEQLQSALDSHQLQHTIISLFSFLKKAIEGREYAKFVFTRSLSQVLKLLADWGEQHQLNRDQMSYLDYSVIRQMYSSTVDAGQLIRSSITSGKQQFKQTESVVLPALIHSEQNIYQFHLSADEPNFITLQSCIGEVQSCTLGQDLAGKILLIPSADPGYDWIFSQGIIGFITKYGGVNSHMAIRAAELNMPAIIGAGEKLYRQCEQAKTLELDCSQRLVRVLQ